MKKIINLPQFTCYHCDTTVCAKNESIIFKRGWLEDKVLMKGGHQKGQIITKYLCNKCKEMFASFKGMI